MLHQHNLTLLVHYQRCVKQSVIKSIHFQVRFKRSLNNIQRNYEQCTCFQCFNAEWSGHIQTLARYNLCFWYKTKVIRNFFAV